ncbi:ABC transporter permease [Legionella septentrionalis]|uniref:ABC transporter permease n=1 Tax=Legionella septentrionalis TaxID=2498109 RepID=UPI000F8D5ACD|nr:ABC transporter permease [Legionella septentrionalis]RUR10103.1 ABC transporter permease [Legionella septentrionalis]
MNLELLWTDQCFLIVLILSLIVIANSLRKEHVRRAYRQIFSKPIAVGSAIILLFFLLIALLDSVHFNKPGRDTSSSLLDYVLAPLDSTFEKTYSAPLALTLYTSETVFSAGHAQQIYPRLKYISRDLKDAVQVKQLLARIILKSVTYSLLAIMISWFFFALFRKWYNGKGFFFFTRANVSALATLLLLLIFAMGSLWLSQYLHVLGTGKIGQDIYYYALKSIRTGLIIGMLTTLFMMPLALLLGIAAGYYGGVIDDIIQYIYTTLSSIPGVLLITASVLSMQTYIANHPEQFTTLAQRADARLLALCFILGITSWTSLCRLLRAEALKIREIDFVMAAKALGSSSIKIIFKHLLPNVMHIVLITLVLDFSFLVLAEAVLSYVGVGVSPLTISWGNMINTARLELARDPIVWWPMAAAFIFMFILVLASNLFADAVRDAFDPRQASV